jgi:hypothetical protein
MELDFGHVEEHVPTMIEDVPAEVAIAGLRG